MWRSLPWLRGLPPTTAGLSPRCVAWSAIVTTPVPDDDHSAEVFRADHFRSRLMPRCGAGDDTDTVAASPQLVGRCVWGRRRYRWSGGCYSAGWPHSCRDLVTLKRGDRVTDALTPSTSATRTARPTPWSLHPHDEGVVLGGIGALRQGTRVGAVVSLCRLADDDIHSRHSACRSKAHRSRGGG